ncbi:phospholipid phosphatase 1-like isoform X3 [Portunus trituberculatus]|uniref:phospholipid phosphatase 1-like isoform X3 n=1 Tax=Portunus trituberculatus TaxID=210409 RepID=UPI001E1CFC65|nr:phospholipid phosphatase 1-like isoform X3 [Portunus trituberculatus]
MSIMEPKYIIRVVMDTIILLTVGGCIFVVKKMRPFERGMFCNDKSISYPFTDHETISDAVLLTFGVAMPVVLMVLLEGWRARHQPIGKSVRICNRRINSWMWGCYTAIGVFLFGCACSQLTTDIAKYSVGRLRPHFVSICKPDWTQIDCVNNTYVDPIPCTTPKENHRMKEARLSFPSGHASFSAYTMVYLAIYLQVRFKFKAPRLLRPFLQFLCLMLTFYTTLSRISDYKHHWSDVLSGFILGTVVATLISVYVSDLFCGSADHEQQQRQCADTIQLQDCSRSSSPTKTHFV